MRYAQFALLGCCLLAWTGCSRTQNNSASGSTSGGDATLKYWQEIHAPFVNSQAVPKPDEINSNDPATLRRFVGELKSLAKAVRASCSKISSMPVLGVDPDATAFAVRFVAVRREAAQLADDLANLVESQSNVPNDVLRSLILTAGRHANDRQGFIWNTAKDVISQGASSIGSMQARYQGMAARLATLNKDTETLNTLEMATRVKLTQRYGLEFPPGSSFPSLTDAPGK